MGNDVILNKAQIIERCLLRIHEEYNNDLENLKNLTKQDSIILNIQRACEAAIDLAMHIVAERKLGLPQSSRDAFTLLSESGLLEEELAKPLEAMVGFRNIAIHNYQTINLDIVKDIIEKRIDNLKRFVNTVLTQ